MDIKKKSHNQNEKGFSKTLKLKSIMQWYQTFQSSGLVT